MNLIFSVFFICAVLQDWRRKRIDLWLYLVFGLPAVCWRVWETIQGEWLAEIGGAGAGVMIGVLLLLFGWWSGSVGAGDGTFFLVSGLYLGFWRNLFLLCGGVLCSGLFCLVYYVYMRQTGVMNVGKRRIPFLPFLIPPYALFVLTELLQ